mgnify:FL=1
MTEKKAKRIVLGITGGIAAYKAAEITRLLRKSAVDVQVVMTEAATRFITPVTMQSLSGNPVFSDSWDPRIANNMAHIELSRGADAILIAPATADFLAKLAHGIAGDLLSTLCIARQPTCPLLVAPAMNREMWESPPMQRNIDLLRRDGVTIVGPDEGDQACGETGPGRMVEPDVLAWTILGRVALRESQSLAGYHALVTAGPTFEPIDPVRGITNSSSGKMGYAIAEALRDAGANVVLVSGPTNLAAPMFVKKVGVRTSSEMFDAVKQHFTDVDLFFAVAAVADYTPASPQTQKIKKSGAPVTIELAPTVDILAWAASQEDGPFCVGFAAESENVVENARIKRERKRIPMIVANSALQAIGSDNNLVTIVDATGEYQIPQASKSQVARQIVAHALRLFTASARGNDANNKRGQIMATEKNA